MIYEYSASWLGKDIVENRKGFIRAKNSKEAKRLIREKLDAIDKDEFRLFGPTRVYKSDVLFDYSFEKSEWRRQGERLRDIEEMFDIDPEAV